MQRTLGLAHLVACAYPVLISMLTEKSHNLQAPTVDHISTIAPLVHWWLQAAALDLVEQAQAATGAFLNLRSVVLQPPGTVMNPGPSSCLAGWLDLPPSASDGPLMVRGPLTTWHMYGMRTVVSWQLRVFIIARILLQGVHNVFFGGSHVSHD